MPGGLQMFSLTSVYDSNLAICRAWWDSFKAEGARFPPTLRISEARCVLASRPFIFLTLAFNPPQQIEPALLGGEDPPLDRY